MRKTAIIAGALCAVVFGCLGAGIPAAPAPVETEKGALGPSGGHVQGFCAGGDAFYVTQKCAPCKFDWRGKLLGHRQAVAFGHKTHRGAQDICHGGTNVLV